MNLENYFMVYEKAIPKKFCEELIRYGDTLNPDIGLVGDIKKVPDNEKDLKQLTKTRNSYISWLSEPWIWKTLKPFINLANEQSGWNYDLSHAEPAQFTRYSKTQHYDWHMDQHPKPYDNPRDASHGMTRKISLTLSLNDGGEYEGGELEFRLPDSKGEKVINNNKSRLQGTLTIFPSFVFHRVSPVKKGTRYSLVVWNLGFPFK
tara:strand:- start:698 stop:1312 length:615 start_codon:yes stop_codon:yes gene_type:complete